MKRSHYIIGGLALAISMPSCLQAQTTQLINRILGYENRVAMTNRAKHDPDPESNEILYNFFEWYLCSTS